ncbi:cyclic pyranopterin monophosphate synthase MoaC [Halegenticoccus soli]|uniref:cyclic pyranopterin monophosphate synthase MoaC n=1 Tax=Halegenticoccus soli TaxID=1985678 RepID=UPI000C6EB95E|nr:cyclic pyranopterin monophosphate synthase MoaC [Halegenticoccus soli]
MSEGTESGDSEPNAELTHTDDRGNVQMVDVGGKPDTARRAVARGEIRLRPETIEAVKRNDGRVGETPSAAEIEKGDVLATARIGAIQAVKHTWETIPMCHQIPITNVDTEFEVRDDRVVLTVAVETTGKTGCEMEALEGVTTGLNVVWDMVKAAEKDDEGQYPGTRISDVRVVEKEKRTPE